MVSKIFNLIDGQRVHSKGDEVYHSINPSEINRKAVEYQMASSIQIESAIEAAQNAFLSWKKMNMMTRAQILMNVGRILNERATELGKIMAEEMGKPISEAIGEVQYSGKVFQFYASESQRPTGEVLHSGRSNVHYYTKREPIGVIGAITPWNFPFSIPSWKIAPALISGNTVVWKPSPQHPYCSQSLINILLESGIPNGVVNLLHGTSNVGEQLTHSTNVDAISFTGSTSIGQEVYRKVSNRLGKVQCEMGGKNAIYIHEKADLDKSITQTIEGAFRSSGQKCTATSRIFVDKKIIETFEKNLSNKVSQLSIGNPLEEGNFLGPVVDKEQFDRIRYYIQKGINDLGKPICGGNEIPINNGYYIKPTLFNNLPLDHCLAREEVFGPVAVLIPVQEMEEAIKLINDTKYGLSSTIMTNDLHAAHFFVENIQCGYVNINLPTAGVEMHAPFGGWKGSGLGISEQGLKVLEFHNKWRSVAMQHST